MGEGSHFAEQYEIDMPVTALREYLMRDRDKRILIAGIGGAGNNFINRILRQGCREMGTLAVCTDPQMLERCKAEKRLLIAVPDKKAGIDGDPERCEQAAENGREQIADALQGMDVLFLVCGLGSGTGTGVTPVVGRIAKEMGIVTVCIAITPFRFESEKRRENAKSGIEKLKGTVDMVLEVSNDLLLINPKRNLAMQDALQTLDSAVWQVLQEMADGIREASDAESALRVLRSFEAGLTERLLESIQEVDE